MKKAFWILTVSTIICSVLALFQYLAISNQVNKLTRTNRQLANVELIQHNNVVNIINYNIDKLNVLEHIKSNSEGLFLFIDYPVCEACFTGVTFHLNKYAKDKNTNLILICKESYVSMIKKKLLFEGIKDIDVQKLDYPKQFTTKMTIVFRSNTKNLFYLPLPEHIEIDFVKTFLQLK